MNLSELSIKRPIFITCFFSLLMITGILSMKRMPVDLFPDITFPIVTVTTVYPGASPREIETLISKPLEDEISTISGIKTLRSVNKEGVSAVIVEFVLGSDIKDAEQQVRNHVSVVRKNLPEDTEEPVITRVDPASQPILQVSLTADLSKGELYDLAKDVIAPQIQQVQQVGLIDILGGRKREIHVKLDLDRLRDYEISASQVARNLRLSGKDIPIGKIDAAKQEKVFRLEGAFPTVQSVRETIVSFTGNDVPVTIGNLGSVEDTLKDEKSRTFVNGKKALLLTVYKQSGSNTVAVAEGVRQKVDRIREQLSEKYRGLDLSVVQDSSRRIHDNVKDVQESIVIGIILTVIVVFFFLGNFRSTLITGVSLPNSLLGAFLLMSAAGFSFNTMSLLALSLSVGLLIDDAIVVRENIFRHMEMGQTPLKAALDGAKEVSLAVIATTFTILAVFGPIGFLQGVVGQFFKEFGLTVCFAMLISLSDALCMAPMLSAYFAGNIHDKPRRQGGVIFKPVHFLLDRFSRLQDYMDALYEGLLSKALRHPLISLGSGLAIFCVSLFTIAFIPKTFLPPQDFGEFMVQLEAEPGMNLSAMDAASSEIDTLIRKNPEVSSTVLTVGDKDGQANLASIYIQLVPRKERAVNTTQFKDLIRSQLKEFSELAPRVTDVDMVGQGMRPFNVNIMSDDLDALEAFSLKVFEKLKAHPALLDPEISHKPGKPEVQATLSKESADQYGVTSSMVGDEIRTLVEGTLPAVFREKGQEYDLRVRAEEEDRNLEDNFDKIQVPNINGKLIPLRKIASLVSKVSPVTINRESRGRYIRISGDIKPGSVGMGGLITDINKLFKNELQLPPGMSYSFVGQAENFQELARNMMIALGLGVLFIYFVLASLYESFVTPLTIMLVLPLAACGAFFALFFTRQSLDIFSMIGCVLLMGVATKNSILLVDYANQLIAKGMERSEALMLAGKTRLRPILMTSLTIIAGMLPVAIGLNEASKQRVSMGISVIGGVVTSTLLTLIVIPAAFLYIDRFNRWLVGLFKRKVSGITTTSEELPAFAPAEKHSNNP